LGRARLDNYGASSRYPNETWVIGLALAVDHRRAALGESVFDDRVAAGAAMEPADGVRYARDQIGVSRAAFRASLSQVLGFPTSRSRSYVGVPRQAGAGRKSPE
jgi:hypothetical protein